jgi:hypothetical protein
MAIDLTFVKQYKEIIAATTGGLLAIIAAYIRREKSVDGKPKRKKPILRSLMWSVFCVILGLACLAGEASLFPVNPDVNDANLEKIVNDTRLDNLGELLILLGCVFVAAGAIGALLNVFRLLLWRKPEPEPVPVEHSRSARDDYLARKRH